MPYPSFRLVLAASFFALLGMSVSAEVDLNGKRFTLADGLTIELAAAAPLTERPICVDFDDRGRLYVAESSGSNDEVQTQLREKPHSILRLEDRDGDGVFDHRTVFADRMMFPEGCEWHDGSLYVAAPPQIWKLTDTNDDGVADDREVWFDGGTLTGCANDLHGPYAGPDGLIYWCKGAFAEQTHVGPGGKPLVTKAAHIFRHDPNTGAVEPVLTGGMDNPVEVAFTRDGEPILSCTFFQHPAGGNRDGLIHAVYGGVWGKDHGVLDGHPRTGDLLPPLVHLGAAAPCGLLRLEDHEWSMPEDNDRATARDQPVDPPSSILHPSTSPGDVLLACSFNLHKVSRHILRPEGGTFATTDDDLVVCHDVDFHPTDVIEDADGSLLIVDTGGWYKLCCPTSQLHKPDVPGAIYRVRRTGRASRADPRGLRLDWDDVSTAELIARFDDDRPAVRQRAVDATAKRGIAAVPDLDRALRTSRSPEARRLAVWTLTRINSPVARAAVRGALGDADPLTRRSAIRSAGLWRDADAATALRSQLREADPHTRRVAAEALGRIGDSAAVPDLLAAAAATHDDRFLHHAITYALIESADPARIRAGLAAESPGAVQAALLALDQIPGGDLSASQVVPRLDAFDPGVRAAAAWVLERHPEWDSAVAAHLGERLRSADLSSSEAERLLPLMKRFATLPAVRELVGAVVQNSTASGEARRLGLKAMAGREMLPHSWVESLSAVLEADDAQAVALAVVSVASAKEIEGDTTRLHERLRRIAASDRFDDEVRLQALRITSAGDSPDDSSFDFLRTTLAEGPIGGRLLAADALTSAALSDEQLRRLAEVLPGLGPMELDRVLPSFAKASDDETGLKLADSLRHTPAVADLIPERLTATFAKYGPNVASAARPLLERPRADEAERRVKLDELVSSTEQGDARRGQAVFRSSKAACASCHAVGYLGGKVGPDLTGIGKIRTDRDLMEAILYPSASFVRSYEPVVVLTTDGQVHSGVPSENADSVALTTAPDKTVTIPRDEIEEMRPGTVSVMPAGLEKQLSPQELADLVAFLKAAN